MKLSRVIWLYKTASKIEQLKKIERIKREMAHGDGAFALIRKEIIKEANAVRDEWEQLQKSLESEILNWAEEIKFRETCREIGKPCQEISDEINVIPENT